MREDDSNLHSTLLYILAYVLKLSSTRSRLFGVQAQHLG